MSHRHDIGAERSNGGQYECSCGLRWMSLDQAKEHRERTRSVAQPNVTSSGVP